MRSIKLVNVKKSFDNEVILKDFNLTIPAKKFFVLLGPSGCGKTTVLRLIGGFDSVESGKIFLDEDDITNLPINKRKINTVFQNYALFPHLNVFDNVSYSLKIRKVDKEIINQKVNKVLKTVHLEKHIYKAIQQLSGGQKQRVALARAIINEPDVLLLDEPLAALDPKLRERMLIELIELQNSLQTTFVYVTHDQSEALAAADQMAIMNFDGEIEQIGTPKEIYEFPATSFVAKFIGYTNIFQGLLHVSGDESLISIENLGTFHVAALEKTKDWLTSRSYVFMSLRPEKLFISKKELKGFDNKMQGTVTSIIYHGLSTIYNVKLANDEIAQVFEQNEEHIAPEIIKIGDTVNLFWKKENVVLLDK